MFQFLKRRNSRPRRTTCQPLRLESLEDRTLLNASPTTVLDLNGLNVNPNKYSSTDILVRFQEPPGTSGGPALVAGTTLGSQLPLTSNFYEVNLDKGMTVEQALAAYKAQKGVLDAEPDYDLTISTIPNDPLLNQQWGLRNSGQSGGTPGADIHAEQAWSVTTGSPNIVVAVMDTGIDYNSPDLYQNIWINQAEIPNSWYTKSSASSGYNKLVYKSDIKTATPGVITFADLNNSANKGLVWDNNGDGRIDAGDLLRNVSQGGWMSGSTKDGDSSHADDLFGWNFVNNTNNPLDDNGHGTHVSGILGASGNNGTGIAGVDWNVQIMPVKWIGSNGDGSVSNFIQGLNYAVQHGAKITNNSWEGAPYSQALSNAFQNAQARGVICVVAAGNEGSNNDNVPNYPANLSTSLNNIVTVAATDANDKLASFSNYGGRSVDLAAPGVNILSTLPGGKYGTMSGTSMATPEVTGALALVWGLHPNWSYTQVINQVLSTVNKLPSLQGKVASGGRLDVAAAVGWNLSTRTIPVITEATPQGPNSSSMNSVLLTFNEPIDVSSFVAESVKLTDPNGRPISVVVRVVNNSGDRQMLLLFSTQLAAGNYVLSINSNIRDRQGNRMNPFTKTITLNSAQTYSNNTATTIKAGTLTASTIQVPPGTVVGDVQVKINASYPSDKDLYIYLVSPNGKAIALFYNRGGTGANFQNTTFYDQAGTAVGSASAPFNGSYRPETALSNLKGINAGGDWRLMIVNSGGQSGTLSNWSLTITPASGSVSSVSSPAAPPPAPAPSPKTYTNSKASTITPWGLTMSMLDVPAGTTIGNLQVKLNANFPADGKLYIYLVTPDGRTLALVDQRGGTGANFQNTVFSDQASTAIGAAKAPFNGTYRPETALKNFNGLNAGGMWRLGVRNYGGSSGTLLNWSLTITPTGGSVSSVEDSSLDGDAPASISFPESAADSTASSDAVFASSNFLSQLRTSLRTDES